MQEQALAAVQLELQSGLEGLEQRSEHLLQGAIREIGQQRQSEAAALRSELEATAARVEECTQAALDGLRSRVEEVAILAGSLQAETGERLRELREGTKESIAAAQESLASVRQDLEAAIAAAGEETDAALATQQAASNAALAAQRRQGEEALGACEQRLEAALAASSEAVARAIETQQEAASLTERVADLSSKTSQLEQASTDLGSQLEALRQGAEERERVAKEHFAAQLERQRKDTEALGQRLDQDLRAVDEKVVGSLASHKAEADESTRRIEEVAVLIAGTVDKAKSEFEQQLADLQHQAGFASAPHSAKLATPGTGE